ncbi:MAG: ATP-binding protein [Syntrophobacteria bacterium]
MKPSPSCRIGNYVGGFLAGTGLGLSLVRAIVHSHGGSVKAISHLGKGSTFTVTLTQPSL